MTCRLQRLYYLKELLKGEAALESTVDSFQSLWADVCKGYKIRRIIKPIRQESSGELRHVLDVGVKNLRALETMQLKMDALSEQVMVNLISNRLDVETRKANKST
jgi:phosphopantetheine adenylyltransferase